MNKILLRDAFFATVSTFLVGWLLKTVVILHVGFLDPVHTAVHHVKLEYENLVTDMSNGKLTDTKSDSSTIFLVNIDTLSRRDIGLLLTKINNWNPKVIAMDVVFDKQGADYDSSLVTVLKQISGKLVTGTFIPVNRKGELKSELSKSDPAYRFGVEGYTNFVSASQNEVVRSFLPLHFGEEHGNGEAKPSFSLAIVKKYNEQAYGDFLKHRADLDKSAPETIVYQHTTNQFAHYEPRDILNDSLSFEELRDKIIIVGFLGDSEDRHYSSFNPEGSSPDMNGVTIHANIVEMILKRDYIMQVYPFISLVISFVITFLIMIFFLVQFVKYHLWFHVVFKLVQFASAVLIFAIGLWLFHSFQLRLDTLLVIAPVALSVDVLYFYDTLVQWMHRRFGYKTYLSSSHQH